MNNTAYRKIYENHYGLIPKEDNGRTYEIHHIDGDHSNNNPANLKAVTIQEHYDIHYAQGDWAACQAIQLRMNKSPEEISLECSKLSRQRVQDGTHHWLGEEYSDKSRERELIKVEKGTHPWMGEQGSKLATERNLVRTRLGLNPFAGEEGSKLSKKVQKDRIEKGTHPFVGIQGGILSKKNNARLLAEGKHSSQNKELNEKKRKKQLEKSKLGENNFQLQIKNGTHPAHKVWVCPHCAKSGKGASNFVRHHGDNCKMKGTI
ncbi:MAG TPA: HNH endonuclease signature motif containing protein [Methanosarcina sp.]|nr:HNH endonuclease signature motif containing protein [Methanosarcina sp.]